MPKLKTILSEEAYSDVKSELKDSDIDINSILVNSEDNEYVPRERLNDKQSRIKALENQLDERDDQIKQLKEDTQATEELQDKIDNLQKKNKKTREEYEQKLQKERKENAIEVALASDKARNTQAVKALLDQDKIEVEEDGSVKGLEDQLKEIKESESYLFDTEEDEGPTRSGSEVEGGGNMEGPEENPFKDKNKNATKQGELIQNQPEVARSLIQAAGKDPSNFGL